MVRLRVLLMVTFSVSRSYQHTADSVGIIPKRLPFTTSNTIVRTFRHAISLDERRTKFKAGTDQTHNLAFRQISLLNRLSLPLDMPSGSAVLIRPMRGNSSSEREIGSDPGASGEQFPLCASLSAWPWVILDSKLLLLRLTTYSPST